MKKKIILGLLAIILLLFLTIFSWALDYDSYLRSRHQEHPDQESNRIPTVPDSPTPMQFITKVVIIPIGQTFPAMVYLKHPSLETQKNKVNVSRKSFDGIVTKTSKTK